MDRRSGCGLLSRCLLQEPGVEGRWPNLGSREIGEAGAITELLAGKDAPNDKPLPELAIRTQIRTGVGAMPSFDESWLTDDEVDAIAEYVQALRAAPKPR